MNADRCPTDAQLRAFQLGDLPEPSLSEVANHLERCPSCESRVRAMDTERDSLLAGLRDSSGMWRSLPDAATLLPPASSPPLASPVAPAVSAAGQYSFLGPAKQPGEIGRLGNYRVLRLLGKGGMGYVFHAEDLTLGRAVALKVMKPELGGELDSWQRFTREARLMAALKHDHLATIYQVGQDNGVIYLAMELLEGESLLDRIRRAGRFDPGQVTGLAREMASALAAIHRQGLIHRDIKPANIWLEAPTDRVKILDFGLARHLQDDSHLTQTGLVIGTPSFMSPEQARGEALDGRSDLFSLGAVLYCMSTGTEPFRGPHVTAVLTALAVESPRPVHEVANGFPRPLSDLVMQLLAKEPEQRPATAEAVIGCLQNFDSGRTIPLAIPLGPPVNRPGSWSQWLAGLSQRQRMAGVAILVGVLILVVGMSMGRGRSGRPSPPSNESSSSGVKTQRTYLKSLRPIASANWPLPPTPDGHPMHNVFRVISVNGEVSPNGIGMHPSFNGPATVSYSLDKKYRAFHGKVSLNDSVPASEAPITFVVYGDGRLLWKSKPVESAKDTQECNVDVNGVDVLRLDATANGKARGAHGVWLEPALEK